MFSKADRRVHNSYCCQQAVMMCWTTTTSHSRRSRAQVCMLARCRARPTWHCTAVPPWLRMNDSDNFTHADYEWKTCAMQHNASHRQATWIVINTFRHSSLLHAVPVIRQGTRTLVNYWINRRRQMGAEVAKYREGRKEAVWAQNGLLRM